MAHLNRGATYKESPLIVEDSLINLLAQTNAKVEQFDLSADGKRLAYVSAQSGGYDLWVCDIDGLNSQRLVVMYPEEAINPSWSPDGEWIAYTARNEAFKVRSDGSEPPINLSYGSGPARNQEFIRWTPDGKRIYFVRGGPNGYSQICWIPTDIPTGKVYPRYVTNDSFNSTDVHVSPDGKWICFMSDRSGHADFKRMDVWIMPIDGGLPRNMTPNTFEFYNYRPRWSPDSRKLVYTTDETNFRNITTIDVETGKSTNLTTSDFDEYNPRWSPDGKWIAYVANIEWNFHVFKIKADGSSKPIQLTTGEGVYSGIDAYQVRGSLRWTADSKNLVFTYMNYRKTSDLYLMSASNGHPKQITNHMPTELEGFPFVKPELITYKSNDGLEIPAFLYKPNNSSTIKTPLVIYARANTKGLHVRGFYPYIQYYLSRGYSVIAPQVRGSAGKGKVYEFLNYGDWGGGDIDDFAYGAYHLIEQGLADPDKVVMLGGSTGGYFTMAMVFRYPDLLAAAVTFYGPPDLIHSDRYAGGSGKPVLGDVVAGNRGGPDSAPDHWKSRSTIYNLDKVKTPMLVLWGDRDTVRISMADDYLRASKENGLYTEYIQYNCEPHGWYHWRPETVIDSLGRIAGHFKKFTGI